MIRDLAGLVARARFFADQENSRFVTAEQANQAVNDGWNQLYELLVLVFEDYFHTSVEIPLVVGTEAYDLPDGTVDPIIYKLRGVDLDAGGGGSEPPIPLRRFQWSERVRFTVPDDSGTIILHYIPVCPDLVATPVLPAVLGVSEIDELPIQVKPGWEDLIAVEAAIQFLAKEQNESQYLLDKRKELIKDIRAAAPARDAEEAPRMIVRTSHLDEGGEGGEYDISWRIRGVSPAGHALRYCLQGEQILFRQNGAW